MCVGLPGRITDILDPEHRLVRVRVGERTYEVSAAIIEDEDLEVGDWLEIHMGHALAKLSEDEAQEVLDFMSELDAAHRGALDALDGGERDPDEGSAS